LILWDAKTGKQNRVLAEFAEIVDPDDPKPAESIDHLAFSPDGAKLLAVTGSGKAIHQFAVEQKEKKDKQVHTFDTARMDWKTVGTAATGDGFVHLSQKKSIAAVSLNKLDGNFIRWFCFYQFPHEYTIKLAAAVDSKGGIFTLTGDPVPHRANVNVRPSRHVLRGWGWGPKPLWEVKLGKLDIATGLTASPDGKLVAVTADAGEVWLFDAKTGKEVAKADKVTGAVWAAAFSPDGTKLVVGCDDKTARVIDTATGKELAVLKGHTESVGAVAFSPDGKMIATGSADKTVKVWEYRP
jgi:WD40 repeat protein